MDQILNTIERLRSRSESERFSILVITVAISVLVIGAIWAATLSYQFGGAGATTEQNVQADTELPGLGELFSRGSAAMTSSTKAVLRNFLLGDKDKDKEQTQPIEKAPVTPLNRAIRLPEQ